MDNAAYNDLFKARYGQRSGHRLLDISYGSFKMVPPAILYTMDNNLTFLINKFNGRVISIKTEVIWPP